MNNREIHLNRNLIEKQKLSDDEITALVLTHNIKDHLFDLLAGDELTKTDIIEMVEKIEYIQQALWKFDLNENYHKWYLVPGCKCPKMDNADPIYLGNRIISSMCTLHGGSESEN